MSKREDSVKCQLTKCGPLTVSELPPIRSNAIDLNHHRSEDDPPPKSYPFAPSHTVSSRCKTSCGDMLMSVSRSIVKGLENFFYRWGYSVAERPFVFVFCCLMVVLTCSLGLIGFTTEHRPFKLWIPQDSGFVHNTEWLQEHFPSDIRFHSLLVNAPNVLTPNVLQWVMNVHQHVEQANASTTGATWQDVCYRLPVVSETTRKRRRRRQVGPPDMEDPGFDFDFSDFDSTFEEAFEDTTDITDQDVDFEPSIDLSVGLFCDIVETMPDACFQNNILDLWNFNPSVVSDLSTQDIIAALNRHNTSRITGFPYKKLLGQPSYNSSGHVIGAKSLLIQWFTRVNLSRIETGAVTNDAGTGDIVDGHGLSWEAELIRVMQNASENPPAEAKVYFMTARSFGDISGATILGDLRYLVAGFVVLFVYVQAMLGKMNMVEHRVYLSLLGMASVGLALLTSYGLCSAFAIPVGPVHNILPFLLLGIGIDDMFVVIQCWDNLPSGPGPRPRVAIRIARTMKHAGVSVTVTSLTDFLAFAVGATTVLPSLKSFCIYAAIGILATYVFQATLFVAGLALDQRRIESHRDGLVPCWVHKRWTPNAASQKLYLQVFFGDYLAPFLLKKPVKIFLLLLTAGIVGVNIWGSVLMRQEFNPLWFLPQSSYLFQFFQQWGRLYPSDGERASLYLRTDHLASALPAWANLVSRLKNETDIVSSVDCWYDSFEDLVNKRYQADLPLGNLEDVTFRTYLKQYLFSPKGAKFRKNFKFNDTLECREALSPQVLVTSCEFVFRPFRGREEHLPAMRRIKDLVGNAPLPSPTDFAFVTARAFANWETDEVIMEELYRNLGMALICVMFTTLVLIANLPACLLVLSCVLLTLVSVNGSMHFWGLTIDTVSCINLVLAIGLCVDYAAHIAHTFMVVKGTKDERARNCLRTIGPAVFHGGFSTFLAFVFLAGSDSHVFTTFFKVFVLVVVYGLFYGLIVLPVILSLIGPAPYSDLSTSDLTFEEKEPQIAKEESCQLNGNSQSAELQLSDVEKTML